MADGPAVISLDKARWRLALLWFPFSAILFGILVVQSIGGVYGAEAQRAWGWALPNVLPTLALMVSVFAADAMKASDPALGVRRGFSHLATALSAFYLLAIFASVFGQAFVDLDDGQTDAERRLALLDLSNIWLAPLQSLVVAAIGVLFFLKEAKTDPE